MDVKMLTIADLQGDKPKIVGGGNIKLGNNPLFGSWSTMKGGNNEIRFIKSMVVLVLVLVVTALRTAPNPVMLMQVTDMAPLSKDMPSMQRISKRISKAHLKSLMNN